MIIAILSSFMVVDRLQYFYHRQHDHNSPQVFLRCPSHLFFHRSFFSTDFQRISQMCCQYLSSLLRCVQPRFSFVMRCFLLVLMIPVFLVLTFAIDLIPLNSSRISCIFSCLLDLLVSLIPLFDLLADVSHLSLLLSVHILFVSMRAKSSWSLLSIVSSLCVAVTTGCCCSPSPANSSLFGR